MLDINSITPTLLAILFVLIATLYLYFKKTYSYWEQRKIPYLKPVVPFGNFQNVITRNWTLGQGFGEAYLELKKLGVKHGGIFAFNKPVYIPVDKEIIKHLLISDADNFPNHGLYINQQDDPLSTHIFNMEGNRWKDIRTKLPQAFTSAKMRQMFNMILDITEQFQKYLDSCIEKYPDGINIKDELAKFTVEVISTCGFGLKSNTMKGENQELMKHTRLFFDYQWNILKNIMVFAFPRNILKALNFRIFRKDSTKFVKEMFEDLQKYRKGGNVQRDDLANTILKLTEKNDAHKDYSGKNIMEPLDSKEYIAQMWVFFCASFETSSSTLTFALYELTKNPECMTKLRQEIKEVLAKNNNKITYDAIMDMKYLECVIDETLRLYPVFPILPRVCKEEYKVPGTDYVMEKDTFVMVSNYGIQRDPEYYPNPLQFDPDRFTSENKGKRPFIANLPFGEGPRICVGKRFGLLQSKIAMIAMVMNYDITQSKKTTSDFKFAPYELILRKDGDIWLHFQKAKY